MTKITKVEFAEGCFDSFEGTQEELAEIIADIQNMVANGTLFEGARELSPEEVEELGMDIEISKGTRQ
jgi:hypothetical protein